MTEDNCLRLSKIANMLRLFVRKGITFQKVNGIKRSHLKNLSSNQS